uniref:Uncharacterized protein n=1 Tax=Neogobius melanostomus TaxID=47308 RepID=A0A8C6SKY7_9GOBI
MPSAAQRRSVLQRQQETTERSASARDFISGYTVLHWLAKNGQDETLFKLLSYAQTLDLHVNVNVRGSGGLTPLHLASMHGQYMVIKLLVGAFGANVDTMDYNGKRAPNLYGIWIKLIKTKILRKLRHICRAGPYSSKQRAES